MKPFWPVPEGYLARGETTVKYELYRLLRWAREGSDRLARLKIDDNPVWRGPAGPQGYDRYSSEVGEVFGFFRGNALRAVVILNIMDREVSIDIPALEKVAGGLALTEESLLPGWGNPRNPPVGEWNPPSALRDVGVAGNTIKVPAHSVSVVHTARKLGIHE